jgi:hypothetical protein
VFAVDDSIVKWDDARAAAIGRLVDRTLRRFGDAAAAASSERPRVRCEGVRLCAFPLSYRRIPKEGGNHAAGDECNKHRNADDHFRDFDYPTHYPSPH